MKSMGLSWENLTIQLVLKGLKYIYSMKKYNLKRVYLYLASLARRDEFKDAVPPMWGNPDSGIQEKFPRGIQNPEKILHVESGIPTFGIQNPGLGTGIPENRPFGIGTIKVESWFQYLTTGVNIVQSGIQDSHGLPYMGRILCWLEPGNVSKCIS